MTSFSHTQSMPSHYQPHDVVASLNKGRCLRLAKQCGLSSMRRVDCRMGRILHYHSTASNAVRSGRRLLFR